MQYIVGSNGDITELVCTEQITGKEYIIGKSTCPLINDDSVEDKHLMISCDEDKWYARDISNHFGSFVKILPGVITKITYGPCILFGNTFMSTNEGINSIRFSNLTYEEVFRFEPIKGKQYTIGRGKKSESIVIKDITISENHSKLTFQENEIEAIDWKDGLGSTNGVYYSIGSGMELPQSCNLRIGLKTWVHLEKVKPHTVMINANFEYNKLANRSIYHNYIRNALFVITVFSYA